jgi:hypothetical protein
MKKSLTIVTLTLLFCSTGLFAQDTTLTCEPYGVSPYMVAQDTAGLYFDSRFTGIANVGVGTKMYLKGEIDPLTLTSPTWTVVMEPSVGAGTFGATNDLDASTQLVYFTPSVAGTYKVAFTDGTFADTLTINAAMYLGVEGGAISCKTCHNNIDPVYDKWAQTGHSDMLVRGLDGTLSSHYGQGCIECHTVGYDPNPTALNDGFDDFEPPFVFPDTLFVGQYDNMVAMYPDAMARANIQCESCHGPGSGHMGLTTDARISTDISAENCAYCHDDGHYHVFPDQWSTSVHASKTHMYDSNYAGGSCAACHNGQGFIDWSKGKSQTVQEVLAITCATCHNPHDASNGHQQVRIFNDELGNSVSTNTGGLGRLCMNCHKSRRDAEEYVKTYQDHYGPHHGPQADMLYATNVITGNVPLPSSAHLSALTNSCVDCHMADAGTHPPYAGGHTFSMVFQDGTDNVGACEGAGCHGPIGTNFSDKKFYMNTVADHDGDGVDEGLQIEIDGLLHKLGMVLPPYDDPAVIIDTTDMPGYSYAPEELEAAYNYFFVLEDRSGGIHNPAFAVSLMQLSIAIMEDFIPVELTSFAAEVNESGNVVLNWTTATETNNQMFEIERSTDKTNFVTIGYVDGFGTTTEPQSYTYTDADLNSGSYSYRLKQIDFDGHYAYSEVVDVVITGPLTFALLQNYPNPFNPATIIEYSIPNKSNVTISVFDAIGNELEILYSGEKEAGVHQITWNATNYASGIYFYRMNSDKFVQVKKMLLLK